MRSRYSAYVTLNIPYLKETLWPRNRVGFDEAATAQWARENHWTGLTVLDVRKGSKTDREVSCRRQAEHASRTQPVPEKGRPLVLRRGYCGMTELPVSATSS